MGRAASMDGMVGSFAATAWNSDRSVQRRLLVGILCLEIWGLWLMQERCLSLGFDGDSGFVGYAGKVFEFGFEWRFMGLVRIWGFACPPLGLGYSSISMSVFLMALQN